MLRGRTSGPQEMSTVLLLYIRIYSIEHRDSCLKLRAKSIDKLQLANIAYSISMVATISSNKGFATLSGFDDSRSKCGLAQFVIGSTDDTNA